MLTYFIAWFGLMFPLVLSPGPANIAFAMSGIKQGIRGSLPFIIGVDLVFLILSIIIGLGLGTVLLKYPMLSLIIKVIGLLYLLYLTIKFMREPLARDFAGNLPGNSTADLPGHLPGHETISDKKTFRFIDGVVLQLMNPKGWMMLFTMFGVFLDGRFSYYVQLILLVVWLCILNVIVHIFWAAAGSYIRAYIINDKIEKIIRYSLSLSMIMVIIFMLLADDKTNLI